MQIILKELPDEPGKYFDHTTVLSLSVKHHLETALTALGKSLAHYDKLWKGEHYRIVFKITLSPTDHALVLKGAFSLHEVKEVHFSLDIPLPQHAEPDARLFYLLDGIQEGVLSAFKKYKTDASGVPERFEQLKRLIEENPDRYLGPLPVRQRVPLTLSEILQAFKIMGLPEDDDVLYDMKSRFDLYQKASADGIDRLTKETICYIDDVAAVIDESDQSDDSDELIYPEFALQNGLEYVCSGELFLDVLGIVFHVIKNPSIECLVKALDDYIKHDFIDVDRLEEG